VTIVAISRELGSGGNAIAAAVAKALNFEFVEREIVLQAAQTHGVPEAKIAAVDERPLSLWQRFDDEKRRYLTFIEAAYFTFAERGNVVTAGRRVKIMAPFDVRVRRVMEQSQVDEKTAVAKVREYHRAICARIDFLFGLDWTQPDHYDLVINTAEDRWQFYTDLIVAAARHPRCQPTPESLQKIQDLSLAAQVRAAIATEPATKNIHAEVTVRAGRVALQAVVFEQARMDAAVEVARRVPGVTQVSCEAMEVPAFYMGPMM